MNNFIYTSVFLMILSITLSAQEFYTYVGKSPEYLFNQRGSADTEFEKGSTKVYRFNVSTKESHTYGISAGKVYMAIKAIYSKSVSKAKDEVSIQILYYMALGFTKQGKESGMTILRKGKRVLSIGWMDEVGGNYSTLVTAF